MNVSASGVLGRSPETLSIKERTELAGQWIAIEIYSPATLPLRLISAIGDSPAACAAMLQSRGLDPAKFEFSLIKRAF